MTGLPSIGCALSRAHIVWVGNKFDPDATALFTHLEPILGTINGIHPTYCQTNHTKEYTRITKIKSWASSSTCWLSDLCETAALHAILPSCQLGKAFLKWVSINHSQIISLQKLPWNPSLELAWQWLKHKDEKMRAKNWTLVHPDSNPNLLAVLPIESHTASDIHVHALDDTSDSSTPT